MKKFLLLFLSFWFSLKLLAQPVDHDIKINEAAYTQAFLHCVNDEKHFAKYAVEANQSLLEIKEDILCKLYIPIGINNLWKNIEKSKLHKKGDFDFKNDFWIGIRFNFYIDGNKVSTAYQSFERPKNVDTSFSYYFYLSPTDYYSNEGELNYAYSQLLSNLKVGTHRINIEAVLPSKDLVKRNTVHIVTGGFILKTDEATLKKWKDEKHKTQENNNLQEVENLPLDYNKRLNYLADSTMKALFGSTGFKKNFVMHCLQNPCEPGYSYANTFYSSNPCTTAPQGNCKEAIITYKYRKKGVPLSLKMLITIGEENENIQIENLFFGNREISIENQNLLSIEEIRSMFKLQIPMDSLSINYKDYSLLYSIAPIYQIERSFINQNKELDFKILKETEAGKKWQNGFVYETKKIGANQQTHIYTFDAVSGSLLWVTEMTRQ